MVQSNRGDFSIPVDVSSTLTTSEGSEVVLRGYTESSAAIVVLREDSFGIVVDSPWGESLRANDSSETSNSPADSRGAPRDPVSDGISTEPLERKVQGVGGNSTPSDVLHAAPPGGHSISFTKHIYEDTGRTAKDPVNAVFYDGATGPGVDSPLSDAGWKSGVCGSDKILYIYDSPHGGSDDWNHQDEDYAVDDGGNCQYSRHHLRTYVSPTGDTHDPGFNSYTVAPVHYEEGFFHDQVDIQTGQDRLMSDMEQAAQIGAIHSETVPYSNSECDHCDTWNGQVDFYQVYGITFSDPCPYGMYYNIIGGDHVVIDWSC